MKTKLMFGRSADLKRYGERMVKGDAENKNGTTQTTLNLRSCGQSIRSGWRAPRRSPNTATWTASGCGCGCCCTSHSDKEQYVWGQGYVDDLVLRDRNPDSAGFTRLYVQQDANYNVTAITNTSGTVQERLVYTPFGQETTLNANWTLATYSFGQFSQDSNAWIYGFQGWRYDPGTGFYTVRNRDYEVVFGWVGADPTAGMYIDGMNLYQPFDSNPTNRVDPSGLDSTDPQSITNPNEADALANQAESDSAYYANLAQNPPTFPVAPPTGPFGGLAIPTQSQDIASYEQLSREYADKAKAYRKRYENLMDINN